MRKRPKKEKTVFCWFTIKELKQLNNALVYQINKDKKLDEPPLLVNDYIVDLITDNK